MEPSEQFNHIIESNYTPEEVSANATHGYMHAVHEDVTDRWNEIMRKHVNNEEVTDHEIDHAGRIASMFHEGIDMSGTLGLGMVRARYPHGIDCLRCGEHMPTPWVLPE